MTRDPESAAPIRQPVGGAARSAAGRCPDRVVVAAVHVVTADLAETTRRRTAPGPAVQPPGSLLRHADEQTVLAVSAVLHAAAAVPYLRPFDDWAVVVSPCEPGRFGCGSVIERFHIDGVRGVPPHAIPNLCLHAAAAAVSIGLPARGPSFGTGGGTGHVADGLLAGLWLALSGDAPGTWAVLCDWEGDRNAGVGRAVALALLPDGTTAGRYSLSRRAAGLVPAGPAACGPVRLAGLADFLTRRPGPRWDCPLDGGGELVLAGEAA